MRNFTFALGSLLISCPAFAQDMLSTEVSERIRSSLELLAGADDFSLSDAIDEWLHSDAGVADETGDAPRIFPGMSDLIISQPGEFGIGTSDQSVGLLRAVGLTV